MKIPLIDLKAQLETLQPAADIAVLKVLHDTAYIMGSEVQQFEREFAAYTHTKHAIGVGNGTDALVIALKALGIGPGDEVITSTFTFFASAEAIAFVGAKPVFVDVDLKTYNLDPGLIEQKISPKTKAIMPVHIFGQPCDMDAILEIAKKHELFVIEDACQAVGATYKGRAMGSLGDIACFSFFPTKNLGCAGDGGMITTDSDQLATICKALRVHGSGQNGQDARDILSGREIEHRSEQATDNTVYNPLKYYNYLIGHNSRLDEIQAALLRVKLPLLDTWNEKRRAIAQRYLEALSGSFYQLPVTLAEVEAVYHMFVLQSEERSKDIECLKEAGIATGVYYPVPLHLQKAFDQEGYQKGDYPQAEYLSQRTFAIPVYPEMSDAQVDYVIKVLHDMHE